PPGLEFPGGQWAIPAHSSGCPNGTFLTGSRTQQSVGGNRWHGQFVLQGDFTENMFEQHFCVQDSAPNNFTWPGVNMCVHRRGGQCPEGFKEGYVQYDDQPTAERPNTDSGDLPDGVFGQDTRFEFCCRDTGFPNEELVLPSRQPFVLIKHRERRDCHLVRGMHIEELRLEIQNAAGENGTIAQTGGDHPVSSGDSNSYHTRYCIYKPAMIGEFNTDYGR
ncbi:Apextrin, partial [Plakobranchus ocellatus]